MKYVATIHFESPTEPPDDSDGFTMELTDGLYEITDFHIEPVEETPPQ